MTRADVILGLVMIGFIVGVLMLGELIAPCHAAIEAC